MKRVLATYVAVVASWTYLFGGLAMAQTPFTVSQVDQQPIPIEEEWDRRCKIVDENLLEKIDVFTARRDAHIEKYEEVVLKFESIIQKLDDADFDTSSLTALMPELESRIAVFNETATAFIAELQATANQSCIGYSFFVADLESSRAGLKGTRLATSDIRQFVVEVLIPEVRNIMSSN